MLSVLRQKYWIPCANSLARKIISECVTCRRHSAAMGKQKMADLPKDRITPDLQPITYCMLVLTTLGQLKSKGDVVWLSDMESSLPVL